jgi:hypothetical protein
LRWCSDANSDAHPNTNTYANTYTNSDANANSDTNACAVAGRTHESGWECSLCDSDQFVVDG